MKISNQSNPREWKNEAVSSQLAAAGVTVAVLSWWGQGDRNESADTQVSCPFD